MPMMKFETGEKILSLNEIIKDDGIYPRDKVDHARIDFFSELIMEGTIFPPIKIAKDKAGRHILLDGFHRLSAFKKLQRNEIICHLLEAEPHLWRLLSVGFNSGSSQPLKLGEIKRAILDAWAMDNIKDKQQIADMVGCSVQWVRRVVKSLDQPEDDEKLAIACNLKDKENLPIRDIARRVGWSKSKTHRMLNEQPETSEGLETGATVPVPSVIENTQNTETETQSPAKQIYKHTERIIENFDRFYHEWKTNQKETLYAFDGIKNNIEVEAISRHTDKNTLWIRNTAFILLFLYQYEEGYTGQIPEISENLSVNIDRIKFIHWLLTHWPNILPGRNHLFQWILANQSQYRDNRISELIRLEHLYWHGKNMDTDNMNNHEDENRLLTELSTDTLTRLNQISAYFEDLKRYLRNYDIETTLAKDLLERLNLIMISQNRIRDHVCKYI